MTGSDKYGNRIEVDEINKKIYIVKLNECVRKNLYKIIPREKNLNFIRKFKLNYDKIKKILLSLSENNIMYMTKDVEYTKYGNEPLIVFKKEHKLIDAYGNENNYLLYIKIKFKKDRLPIISIHLDE